MRLEPAEWHQNGRAHLMGHNFASKKSFLHEVSGMELL